jgi:hypothetical protein
MKDAKPRRMHGITPTPFDMPAELRPQPGSGKTSKPFFVTLICGYLLLRGAVNLLLALIPWSDPQSAVATFFLERPALVFSVLPRVFRPAETGGSAGAYMQIFPFLFLTFGLIYLFSAWKLWELDKFWVSLIRWGIMFISGATVAQIAIELSARYVGAAEAPLSDAARGALVVMVAWNALIFFCFALFPAVEDAYDRHG